MNICTLGGTIHSNLRLKKTASNISVMNLVVITVDTWTDNSGISHRKNNHHNIKLWGNMADIVAKKYKKNSYIMVAGRLETKMHKGHPITELIVDRLENTTRHFNKVRSSENEIPTDIDSYTDYIQNMN